MKFPVIKAFGATFAYLAARWLPLAKALWFPVALLVGLQLYTMTPLMTATSSIIGLGENPDPAEAATLVGELGKWGLVMIAGSAVAYPMMTVASLLHLVRGEELKAPIYLRYGGDELRLLAAYILLSGMLLVISIVGGLGATVVVVIVSLVLPQARAFLNSLAEIAVNLATIWFRLRLSVLYPASISTGTIGFGASWEITKGHAWPLFFFWVLISLAVTPLIVIMSAPFAGEFFPLFQRLSEAGADQAQARQAIIPILDAIARLFSPENPSFALFAAVLFAATLATTAVFNVAAGISWRFLTDRDAAPSAAQAMAA
ncbi:MAG: hypothetical protein A3E78_06885 [Alphaproteobacteria bacterium RIFCSPHIGHO2_12_FULL_63_12]|nr:MAG: hypothetical protein A3E78_06885 [Alphaproteobacteria bacterium RIFCSPHIGHO2_12_FULL_63_12]